MLGTLLRTRNHLWRFSKIRKMILDYLTCHISAHKTIRALLSRLTSKFKNSSSASTQKRRRAKIYQRPSGGWIVLALGTRRVFSTRARATNALRIHKRESAKASGLQGLGGGVAVVCTTPQTISKTSQTLRKYIHIPRHNTSLIRNNHQEWAGTKPRKNHKQGSGKAKYHRQTRRSSKT